MTTEPRELGLTAIYGGAFDPPHYGHLSVVNLLLSSPEIDQVWIVPSGLRPDKKTATAASLRLRMTELAFERSAKVTVCDYHAEGKSKGHGTIDLLRYCRDMHPELRFGIVIGCELVNDLAKWKDAESLKKEGFFIVTPREGVEFDESCLQGYSYISLVHREHSGVLLSSSDVRRNIQDGKSLEGVVPPAVADFIKRNRIYQEKKL